MEQADCGWLNNRLQRDQFLISGTCKYYLIWKKGLYKCDYVKDFKVGRRSWLIHMGPKCNHVYPHKSEAEGDSTWREEEVPREGGMEGIRKI